MKEKPRRRDESLVSKSMMANILVPGIWMVIVGFVLLKCPFILNILHVDPSIIGNGTTEAIEAEGILHTVFFVYFIWAALFNGFNCRSDGLDITKGLKENKNFLKVFLMIVLIQAFIICIGLIPLNFTRSISMIFSCVPIHWECWVVAIVLAITVIPIGLLNKVIFKNKK